MAAVATTTDITVNNGGGSYTTCTVRGARASSTCSAEEAANRLGRKLYGTGGFQRAEQLPRPGTHVVSAWRLYGISEAGHVL